MLLTRTSKIDLGQVLLEHATPRLVSTTLTRRRVKKAITLAPWLTMCAKRDVRLVVTNSNSKAMTTLRATISTRKNEVI